MNSVRLKAVELAGFKSFAKRTELIFGPGVTAVIGPNGSGKSNLAEAVRWVLGEQSVKQLRGKDRTDVIFAGSDGTQQARAARVMLRLDNETGWFPLSAAEVEIGRELTRSGESTYVLNGEPIRLADLSHLLAEAGIGAKSFTVISQGMVDRYLTASPAERQELFDEATGIKGLQMKLTDTERKLGKARHLAQELEMLIQEIRPRLTVLERQIERHQEHEEKKQEFEAKRRIWFHAAWHDYGRRVHQAEARFQAIREEIGTARAARQAAERQLIEAARSRHPADKTRQQLWQAEQAYTQARAAHEQRERQRAALAESLQAVKQELKTAEAELAAVREGEQEEDWMAQARQALQACYDFLQQIRTKTKLSQQTVSTLSAQLERILQAEAVQDPVRYAENLMRRAEAPLQQVARLKAIQEERRRQLETLPAEAAPSDQRVRELRAALQQGPGADQQAMPSEMPLETAREAEIAAEREGSAAEAALAQSQQELHVLEQEILRELGSTFLADIQEREVPNVSIPRVEELRALEMRLAELGEIDPLALKEYEETRQRAEDLQRQFDDIQETEGKIVAFQEDLQATMAQLFAERFAVIQEAFASFFEGLFGGGKATLERLDEGVDITVTPPGKRPRHIALLSGGEKALTSLALLLAIIEVSKPPFMVLDEVDAALDEANSRRLARIIKEKSTNTQVIVITHNRETMSQAEILYGVTMQGNGVSKVYSVKMAEIADIIPDGHEAITI